MDIQNQRDLRLLTEVELDPAITQRSLARKVGLALGLTNLYLKRLVRKGYVKITTIPRNRIKYLVTPRGLAEKSRLTYEFMRFSFIYYRSMRKQLGVVLGRLSEAGARRLVIYGTGELAELSYLSICETGLSLVGFLDVRDRPPFLSYPVRRIAAVTNWTFDAILIADLSNDEQICDDLARLGVPRKRIVKLAS